MSSMPKDILEDLQKRLVADFGFKVHGKYYRQGKCPKCNKREMWTYVDSPWVLKCARGNRCGEEIAVKDRYDDLFDTWSNRFRPTESNPKASADAYLRSKRRLDLTGMRGCYEQETYFDHNRRISSATIRFPLPGGGWWERLIDQERRFDRKAHFKPNSSVNGYWWQRPDHTMEDLARASELWIAEGVFDAWMLSDKPIPATQDEEDQNVPEDGRAKKVPVVAVANMSTNFYPSESLKALRKVIADLNVAGPKLVWAFDNGKAGTEFTRKWVARARKEGWDATAAQPRPEGEADKLDWNDLGLRGRLTAEDLETYRFHGKVLLADNANEKAVLLWDRHRWPSFSFIFENRTWWASFDDAKIAEAQRGDSITELAAARLSGTITEIANCAFRVLYHQYDDETKEGEYYFRVDSPSGQTVKAGFAGGAVSAAAEFKKRLVTVASGAVFTGSTFQLDRLFKQQADGCKKVQPIDFIGYSRDHEAWFLGKIAVFKGRLIDINDEDYFDLGASQIKLRSLSTQLDIHYDADRFDTSWVESIWTAYRGNGMVTLTFWVMSFFAEQIRKANVTLGFLEMSGIPGTGKSTLIEFLWKLAGREGYEGFNPSKASRAAIGRNLARVANMPVVLMEGDRQDNSHAQKFDFDELKEAYGGKPVRSIGVKNQGMDTKEPPFRAALIIEQNFPVNASPAIMERIMLLNFTKEGWGQQTKIAAEKLEQWPTEDLSGTIIHMIRKEAAYMEAFHKAFADYVQRLTNARKVRNERIRKTHAQLHAGVEALGAVMKLPDAYREAAHQQIDAMAIARDQALQSDHPIVADFWEAFDYIENRQSEEFHDPINVSKDLRLIAVNLQQFEARCAAAKISCPPLDELKKHLRTSKSRPFDDVKTVNAGGTKRLHCWIFKQPAPEAPKHGDKNAA